MAGYTSFTCLVLFAMSMYYLSSSISTSQSTFEFGSLVCKTYNMFNMDCNNRNLLNVPELDQNWTISLDLSHNQLRNITNAPFEKLKFLLMLNLSYNKISQMSLTSFRGLHSLETLILIFPDLCNVQLLDMSYNWFTAIPGQVIAPLFSLRYLLFLNARGIIQEIDFGGFENLTNLNVLELFIQPVKTNISSDIFHPLRKLPLRDFTFVWLWSDEVFSTTVSKDAFAPLTSNMTHMQTAFSGLQAVPFLRYPCQNLSITAGFRGKSAT